MVPPSKPPSPKGEPERFFSKGEFNRISILLIIIVYNYHKNVVLLSAFVPLWFKNWYKRMGNLKVKMFLGVY